jgi:hypothetical protein
MGGGRITRGALIPVPKRLAETGTPPLLTTTEPLAAPGNKGEKTTSTLQEESPGIEFPQPFPTTWKGPVVDGDEIGAGLDPGFEKLKMTGTLVAPTGRPRKSKVSGETSTGGAVTDVPFNVIVCGLPEALSQM